MVSSLDSRKAREPPVSSGVCLPITDLIDSVGHVFYEDAFANISSTEIRRKVRLNKSISGLVPTTVEKIILEIIFTHREKARGFK